MKKSLVILPVLLLLVFGSLAARSNETYFKFQIDSRKMLDTITRIISIDNVVGDTVYAYANADELAQFERLGYHYEVLQHPGTLIVPEMSSEKSDIMDWNVYPTYDAYVSMMNQFASDYPTLCQIHNVGTTVDGRSLLFLEISDNVGVEEDEPAVLFTSSIHGDETTGYVTMLRFADSLLSTYGTDTRVTDLVDNSEIWICPLANPDGTYAGGNSNIYGATRYNSNGYDLNRNFPDPDDGPYPGGTRQIETQEMMDFADAHSFVIGSNFHGGSEVINYPWDTWARLHADDSWCIDVSRQFADSAQYYSPSGYLTDLNNGITNGYAWYTISGGRQDYMNYWHGCREVTMEISGTKLVPASQLPAFWGYLKTSLFDWAEQAQYGIRGIVTDANTGLPMTAMIRLIGHDSDADSSMVYTDPDVGDYHRMIDPGTYDVEFSCPGYFSDTLSGVSVYFQQATRIDVSLTPLPDAPLLGYVSNNGGLVDPGDDVLANVTLKNYGLLVSFNTTGVLSSSDPYIDVIQNSSGYPDIDDLGGTAESYSQYEFSIEPSCPMNYTAQFRIDVTADGGYVDSIFFSKLIGQQNEDFETGDFAHFPWVMGGDQDWLVTSSNVYEGTYAAQSGDIYDDDTSSIELTAEVLAPGEISFHYKVSSESGWDYLRFYIDGSEKAQWSGTVPWSEASYPVTAGTHTFRWAYTKDGSQSSGSDCGWVDEIIFPSLLIAPEISTVSLPDWTVSVGYSQQLEATGGTGVLTWSDKNGDLEGTGLSLSSSGLISGIPISAQQISFVAQVTDAGDESDEQTFVFEINPMPQILTESLPDWTQGRTYSQLLSGTGGTGSLTWTDENSNLAGTGLSLSTAGLLSGIPTVSEPVHFTALLTDNVGANDEQAFDFYINPSMTITVDELPNGTVGEEYSFQLTSEGGTGTKTWSDKYGSLAGSGLSLSEDGLLSGIPVEAGTSGFYAEIQDETGAKVNKQLGYQIDLAYVCGDANADESVDISDAVAVINYVFIGGSAPDPMEAGDCNCDSSVDISDAVFIINFVFIGGNVPCDTTGDGVPDC